MLSELFGVVGAREPLEDDAIDSTHDPELADARAQASLQVRLEPAFFLWGIAILMCHASPPVVSCVVLKTKKADVMEHP
jgi:hypothetical protein